MSRRSSRTTTIALASVVIACTTTDQRVPNAGPLVATGNRTFRLLEDLERPGIRDRAEATRAAMVHVRRSAEPDRHDGARPRDSLVRQH